MAAGGDYLSKVMQTLTAYKDRSETTNCLKLTPFLKCVTDCGMSQYKSTIESRVWATLQDKSKKIPIDKCSTVLIDTLASIIIGEKRKPNSKAPIDDPEVQKLANEIRLKIAAKAGETVLKEAKVDATTARLTDVKGYTGAHKERFGADGKGKGIEGRKDLADTSGYVGNYKGAGTYDKK
ncbi:hypothetical protein BsWGS_05714 [Bradybaena similaris]